MSFALHTSINMCAVAKCMHYYFTVPCTFNSGTINDCAAHLINQGVVVSGSSATVEWQGTGPDPDNTVQNFVCSLDGGTTSSCKSAIFVHDDVLFSHLKCSKLNSVFS